MKRCVLAALAALTLLVPWLSRPAVAAEMTEPQARKALADFFTARPYYPVPVACLKIAPGQYKNRGYAFTVDTSACLDAEPGKPDSWRVDAATGEVFVRNAAGKYQVPVCDDRLLSADAAEALVVALPEVRKEMRAHKNAFLMLEGHPERADTASDPAGAFYDFYFGHDMGTHTTRLWGFRVNALTREILVADPVSGEDLTLEAWRGTLDEDHAPHQK